MAISNSYKQTLLIYVSLLTILLAYFCFLPKTSYSTDLATFAEIESRLNGDLISAVNNGREYDEKCERAAKIAKQYIEIGDLYSALAIAGRMTASVIYDDDLKVYVTNLDVDSVMPDDRRKLDPKLLKKYRGLFLNRLPSMNTNTLRITILIEILKNIPVQNNTACYKLVEEILDNLIYVGILIDGTVDFEIVMNKYSASLGVDAAVKYCKDLFIDQGINATDYNLSLGIAGIISYITDKHPNFQQNKLLDLISKTTYLKDYNYDNLSKAMSKSRRTSKKM